MVVGEGVLPLLKTTPQAPAGSGVYGVDDQYQSDSVFGKAVVSMAGLEAVILTRDSSSLRLGRRQSVWPL